MKHNYIAATILFISSLGIPIGLSKEARNCYNKWKQSLNHCYDAFITSKYNDHKVKLRNMSLMARVVDDADKLAVQHSSVMSQVPSTFQHENLPLLKVMCAGSNYTTHVFYTINR